MDVKCERCNTEYEFDDALVSGRGTTVKCTNCGHKFKIRRNDGDFSEDFWNVTTGDGRTLVFTSLRELQRAIQGYLVERNDRLSRGGLPPKAIGQIPELAPFFDQREAAKRGQAPERKVRTQDGLGPAAEAAQEGSQRRRTKPEFPAPPAAQPLPSPTGKPTLLGTGPTLDEDAFVPAPAPPAPAPANTSVAPATERQPEPSFEPEPQPAPEPTPPLYARTVPSAPPRSYGTTMPMDGRPTPAPEVPFNVTLPIPSAPPGSGAVGARGASHPPRGMGMPGSTPPRQAPVYVPVVPESSSPLPPAPRMRSLLEEIEEERERVRGPSASDPGPHSRRRSVGGFIVAAVVAGCLLMLGAVWAQKNLGVTLGTKPAAPVATVDPRVSTFLANGEKALSDGNLELAKESFDKASALSERDPKVLLGVARLAAMRADVMWLKSRLLPSDATDDHRITRDGLNELAAGARKAADDALTVAPDDTSAVRAKIDALRISGDREGGRALVARITASSAQPETAYVLAALDLAEVEPLWSTVIDRLKVASSAETGPGRARAALVFALARSGDFESARAEVDRLAAMPKGHPLLSLLRAVADKTKGAGAKDGGAALSASADDAGKAGRLVNGGVNANANANANPNAPLVAPPAAGLPSDPRDLVAQGERARAKGDYDRARTLFSAAADRNPNDSEALAGLAAISYAQRDLAGARAAYKRVLGINPNYMPALVGLADVEWDSGDKGSATKMYKDIVDRYPPGAYPAHVKSRVDAAGGQ